ncbi:hypothetical protein [Spirillospora albida]|uniref:hypothetical protein n=1 Tax=Spirillospora albida TaxID=58123 RepID=UPI000A016F71|nr:hypothetical protein [Spirillospora albida]
MPEITYYAILDEGFAPSRPAGIVRRVHATPRPTDEAFTRNMQWEPTEFLVLHWLGHNDEDYVEITAQQAQEVIDRWKRQRVEPNDGR